jgi:predicted transcriptional regulator
MNTLTLKIPDALDTALQLASARRHMTKSAVVREALEQVLADELKQTTPAANWLGQWRGALTGQVSRETDAAAGDARVAHILQKHLR